MFIESTEPMLSLRRSITNKIAALSSSPDSSWRTKRQTCMANEHKSIQTYLTHHVYDEGIPIRKRSRIFSGKAHRCSQ